MIDIRTKKKKEALEYFMLMAIKELKPYLVKAILFGSYARKETREDADIDILMVHYDNEKRFLDKIGELSFQTSLKYGELIQAIPISLYEYKARKDNSFFLKEVARGEVIFSMDDKEAIKLEANDYLNLGDEFISYGKGALERGEYRNAVDDIYNGIELLLKTLILLKGEGLAHSHGGIIQQFGKLYIGSGEIAKEFGKRINKALILRGKARYDPKAYITDADAKDVVDLGEAILRICRKEAEKI